jgi:hypothetical protein
VTVTDAALWPPETESLRCQPSALVVAQPNSLPAELFLEHAVLLDQVLDDALLLDVDPACERQEKDSQRVGFDRHEPIVAAC